VATAAGDGGCDGRRQLQRLVIAALVSTGYGDVEARVSESGKKSGSDYYIREDE
jgi:hypothetical protein